MTAPEPAPFDLLLNTAEVERLYKCAEQITHHEGIPTAIRRAFLDLEIAARKAEIEMIVWENTR